MHDVPLLEDLTVIIAVGMAVAVLLSRLKLPSTAGLLAAGALMGPTGIGLIESHDSVEALAEIGVILLLFTIGLEFSLERLARIAGLVMIGGSLQVGLTTAAAIGIGVLTSASLEQAVLYGFVMSLSSTAIVLRSLNERAEIDAPHGRFIVGVLIFQDLAVVPMMLVIPLLVGSGEGGAVLPILIALGKAALVVAAAMLLARVIVPPIFAWVDRTNSREVFLLAVLTVCIGTAWATSLAGLSLALGAFLGGMVVAGTVYGRRALGDILPLRDVFMSLFFVSLGMFFDGRVVLESPVVVVLLLAAFVVGKLLIAALAAMAMRFPARVAFLSGIGLAQFGEFGFVLIGVAHGAGLVTPDDTRQLLAAGIISMFLTPVLVRLSPHMAAGARLLRPLERLLGVRGIEDCRAAEEALAGHVVVVGYGVAGRLVTGALAEVKLRYIVVELNADVVRAASQAGEPIYYGDIASEEALHHARVEHARAVVILINDREAAERAVSTTRRVAPEVPIFLRTRYLSTGPALAAQGATDIVFEEVEAGVEMLARVLRMFDVPRNLLGEQLARARDATQASVRTGWIPRKNLGEATDLDELKIDRILIRGEDAGAGRSAVDLDLRRASGALVVALRRDGALLSNPDPAQPFVPGDLVYLVGSPDQIIHACRLLGEDVRPPRVAPA